MGTNVFSMKKYVFVFLAVLVLISGCAQQGEPAKNDSVPSLPPAHGRDFCGISTRGSCTADSDCIRGGCSGQVCQSAKEEPVITTCEYVECYDPALYKLSCGCNSGKCQWG